MPESFGARLRQQREDKQIALSAIADETKIKLALLEALERDDVSQWPSGIFRRAYMRTYAHMIGLDPDAVLHEFLERHPEPADMFTQSVDALATAEDPSKKGAPPTRLRTMMDSAIESIAKLRRPPVATVATVPSVLGPDQIPEARPIAQAPPPTPDADVDREMPEPVAVQAEPSKERVQYIETRTVPVAAPFRVPGSEIVGDEPEAPAPTVRVEHAVPVAPQPPARSTDVHLEAVAGLCTALGRVSSRNEVQRLLGEAARILGATGLIVWLWDEIPEELRPALTYGYSDKVLAQLPIVKQDADNPTAAAFRSCQAVEMPGSPRRSGAVVVPMVSVEGCAGVLAIELQPGEYSSAVRSIAAIVAAALTQLTLRSQPAEALPVERMAAVASFKAPSRPVRVRR